MSDPLEELSDAELLRYSRHIMLPEVDVAGQQAIRAAHVLVVGLGGLGSPIALYLAASGVGTLTLTDHDVVDESNLQRQIIHTEARTGSLKVASAAAAIHALNPAVTVHQIAHKLESAELLAAVASADVVVDATDNFGVRYALNAACLTTKTPLVSGAAVQFDGQLTVFDARLDESPCYRCLYKDADDSALNCSETGVIAPLVGIIGSMQALEALKLITGVGTPLVGKLLLLDGRTMGWHQFKLTRNPKCPDCGTGAAATD